MFLIVLVEWFIPERSSTEIINLNTVHPCSLAIYFRDFGHFINSFSVKSDCFEREY